MKVETWGLIDYKSSVDRQLEAVEDVASGGEERIVLCTHPPVVTKGRATTAEDILSWSGDLVESSRGGRATYHGPSQLVMYPILDLRRPHPYLRERDVHVYLRWLENFVVEYLSELGLPNCRATPGGLGEAEWASPTANFTGVWIENRKIASIGIAVRKWVTYHGVALNLQEDSRAHQGIRPCGFSIDVMTSVEKELGRKVSFSECEAQMARLISCRL